jgi:hypothetical protein
VKFKVIGEIERVETFARGTGVRVKQFLNETYGRGNWRKRKGVAVIEYVNGEVWLAEIHWYEAHGIGRRREKDKRRIRRLA